MISQDARLWNVFVQENPELLQYHNTTKVGWLNMIGLDFSNSIVLSHSSVLFSINKTNKGSCNIISHYKVNSENKQTNQTMLLQRSKLLGLNISGMLKQK